MSEAEAMAIRFTIDHYEPRTARPDLTNDYSNLMYACDECNMRKGNRYPPLDARAAGYRFFRPDNEIYSDHFQWTGIRLEHKTPVAYYTIEALDLNRAALRKLRDLRKRLTDCHELVANGVLSLRKFHIDQIPAHIKGPAHKAIADATAIARQLEQEIDSLLQRFAHSPLLESDPDAQMRSKERAQKLAELKVLFPGSWRADTKPAAAPKNP
jgi:regulator of sigma D